MVLTDLEIRDIPIELINPAAYNPRKDLSPNDEEYKKLEQSLNEFGYADPIIWNETTGNLVGGHQRLKILINNGAKSVKASVVHMEEMKEKAFNIALNKISGCWDNEKLNAVIDELINEGADISKTGFSEYEINGIINSFENSSFIDELLNDDFISSSSSPEYFQATFTFKTEHKEAFDKYIKENGKETLSEKILQWIEGESLCQTVEVK